MCCQNSSDPGYQNRQSGKQFKHCLAQSFSVFLSFSIRHIHSFYRSIRSGKLDHAGYISVARQIAQRFGCRKVAITLRGSLSASDNDWAGMLYDAASDKAVFSPTYRIHIVDRVGGGDSFGGGLIYALMSGKDDQAAINFAVAASCLKHSVIGDFNRVGVSDVEKLMGGDGTGRVQR